MTGTLPPTDNGRVPLIMQRLDQVVESLDEGKSERAEMLTLLQAMEIRMAVNESQQANCVAHAAEQFGIVWKELDEQKKDIDTVDKARKWEGRLEALFMASVAAIGYLKG